MNATPRRKLFIADRTWTSDNSATKPDDSDCLHVCDVIHLSVLFRGPASNCIRLSFPPRTPFSHTRCLSPLCCLKICRHGGGQHTLSSSFSTGYTNLQGLLTPFLISSSIILHFFLRNTKPQGNYLYRRKSRISVAVFLRPQESLTVHTHPH